MKPAVGRKVWLWGAPGAVFDRNQPFDATIVFVHSEWCVNVVYRDHAGAQWLHESAPLSLPRIPAPLSRRPYADHGVEDTHASGLRATWMPYQVGQAAAAAIGAAGPVTAGGWLSGAGVSPATGG